MAPPGAPEPRMIRTKTDRLMARAAVLIFALGACYAVVLLGRPLYYRFAADVLRPFQHEAVGSSEGGAGMSDAIKIAVAKAQLVAMANREQAADAAAAAAAATAAAATAAAATAASAAGAAAAEASATAAAAAAAAAKPEVQPTPQVEQPKPQVGKQPKEEPNEVPKVEDKPKEELKVEDKPKEEPKEEEKPKEEPKVQEQPTEAPKEVPAVEIQPKEQKSGTEEVTAAAASEQDYSPKPEGTKSDGGEAAAAAAAAAATAAAATAAAAAAATAAAAAAATAAAGAAVASPAAEQKPYNVDDFPLTKDRLAGLLQDGYIMVTWANHHYLDFAKSWVYNVRKAGITGYIVGAMDDDMLKCLYDARVNTWRMATGITKTDLGWGSPNFHKMGRAKISLIKQFLDLDVQLIISDIDTVWMRYPYPFFDRYPTADVLTSSDQLTPTVQDESLEKYPQAGASFNIGIMLFRPRAATKDFVTRWIESLEKPDYWDQAAFNDLARMGFQHQGVDKDSNLWKGDNGRITMGVLPAVLFAAGHTFYTQHKHEEMGLKPYVAHATFQYSGTVGKRERMRSELLFDDPPEHFDHPVGFIALNIDIPAHLLAQANGSGLEGWLTADMLDPHFQLVHYQLLRLRTALALATITGRAVIMPPIWCEVDKYWSQMLNGNIPGTSFKKPFICPLDHVLDLEAHWAREDLPVDAFGPYIGWRERSFLQNPRLSAAVNSSRLLVEACPAASDCPGGSSGVQGSTMRVSKEVDITRMRTELNHPPATSFKIIELTSGALEALHDVWKTLPQPELDRFMFRLKHYPANTCCMKEHPPGWVWYDFLMDVPHNDRFNRPFKDGHIGPNFIYYKGDQKDLATLTVKPMPVLDANAAPSAVAREWVAAGGLVASGKADAYQLKMDWIQFSQNHCRVYCKEDDATGALAWFVEDTSTNGTWVNSARVPKGGSVPIGEGDALRLSCPPSDVLEYKFMVEEVVLSEERGDNYSMHEGVANQRKRKVSDAQDSAQHDGQGATRRRATTSPAATPTPCTGGGAAAAPEQRLVLAEYEAQIADLTRKLSAARKTMDEQRGSLRGATAREGAATEARARAEAALDSERDAARAAAEAAAAEAAELKRALAAERGTLAAERGALAAARAAADAATAEGAELKRALTASRAAADAATAEVAELKRELAGERADAEAAQRVAREAAVRAAEAAAASVRREADATAHERGAREQAEATAQLREEELYELQRRVESVEERAAAGESRAAVTRLRAHELTAFSEAAARELAAVTARLLGGMHDQVAALAECAAAVPQVTGGAGTASQPHSMQHRLHQQHQQQQHQVSVSMPTQIAPMASGSGAHATGAAGGAGAGEEAATPAAAGADAGAVDAAADGGVQPMQVEGEEWDEGEEEAGEDGGARARARPLGSGAPPPETQMAWCAPPDSLGVLGSASANGGYGYSNVPFVGSHGQAPFGSAVTVGDQALLAHGGGGDGPAGGAAGMMAMTVTQQQQSVGGAFGSSFGGGGLTAASIGTPGRLPGSFPGSAGGGAFATQDAGMLAPGAAGGGGGGALAMGAALATPGGGGGGGGGAGEGAADGGGGAQQPREGAAPASAADGAGGDGAVAVADGVGEDGMGAERMAEQRGVRPGSGRGGALQWAPRSIDEFYVEEGGLGGGGGSGGAGEEDEEEGAGGRLGMIDEGGEAAPAAGGAAADRQPQEEGEEEDEGGAAHDEDGGAEEEGEEVRCDDGDGGEGGADDGDEAIEIYDDDEAGEEGGRHAGGGGAGAAATGLPEEGREEAGEGAGVAHGGRAPLGAVCPNVLPGASAGSQDAAGAGLMCAIGCGGDGSARQAPAPLPVASQ
ncbi:hypothetical protein FOA52_015056 [Chlamydomonas sp. UWO 241]|nr:hypothetical protein FOA52_015056 [Chlamydomonas sp. UWO 241]